MSAVINKTFQFLLLAFSCWLISCSHVAQSEKLVSATTTPTAYLSNYSLADALGSIENFQEPKYFLPSDTCKKIKNKEDRLLCTTLVKDNDLDQDATFKEFSYLTSRLDLNMDGKQDAIVWINDICGTSGCPFYFYKKTKNGFSRIFDESAWTPIILINRHINGWKTIAYQIAGGGVEPYFVMVEFDGLYYRFKSSHKVKPKGKIVLDRNWKQSFFGPIPAKY